MRKLQTISRQTYFVKTDILLESRILPLNIKPCCRTFFSFSLAGLFLSIFSYYSLKIYFNAQKSEQFNELIVKYSRGAKTIIKYREGIPEHHIALANGYTKLSSELHGFEVHLFTLPKWMFSIVATVENFSLWYFSKDIFQIRESLLIEAIEEHIKLVKCEPTSLDIHAALANAYVILSGLYLKAKHEELAKQNSSFEYEQELDTKFRLTAEKAIEEFKILNDFAPNDPWVHTQLAYSYRDLKMPEEEIAEYEIILKLRPDDVETLFKLGCLYFQQGRNSNGLRVYEKIKNVNFKKAEQLISFYGSVNTNILVGDF